MSRVGKFEKVSFEQFCKDARGTIFKGKTHISDSDIQRLYEGIEVPTRATAGSAGYDFKSPFSFLLEPGESIRFPTGIRCKISDGWWLACVPRSSLGFKYRLQFDNTVGVIDSDFVYAENEGDISAKLTNDSKDGETLHIEAGERFMQAIFIPYGITYDDNTKAARNGGIGSTGR